jgi:capsular exopolysaccharide synthesis family protein
MTKPDLITLTDPRSLAAEAYRTLRTNLTFAALDAPLKTLVATTVAPDNEKARVLANLAVAMAQGEQRTILVEADLRRPTLHEIFGVASEPGLTTMIVNEAALSDPPLKETGVPNLRLLPSGPLPPNPADLLGSQKMEQAIVIFDAPPVVSVTDAVVLGTKVDGVLLVASAGRTRREHAQRAKELLERVHIRIVGTVLNNAPRGAILGRY